MVKAPPEHFNLSFQDSLRSTKGTFTDEIDTYRGISMPSMTSSNHLDTEELLWSHTQAVAAPAVDFDRLSNMSLDQWDSVFRGRKYKHNSLQGFARRRVSPATTEVLVTGELQCTVAEAEKLLCSSGESGYNEVMARIHGRSFLRGSVVHSFTRGENQELASSSVKTAGFKHPTLALLDPDEQWCFLEEFHASQDAFTLSQRSLNSGALPSALRPPVELVRRRNGFTRSKKRTHQLMGLSLGYSVEAVQGKSAVQLVFYGCASGADGESSDIVERRLRKFARSLLKLPELLQHNKPRQEPQTRGQLTSKRLELSKCVGCSRKFHKLMMIKKTRCYLCALFVCWKCWNRQPLNTINGRKVSVLVCPHCLDSIQTCNYRAPHESGRSSSSSASTSSHGTAGEIEDIFRGQVLPDPRDAPQPGSAVVAYLTEALDDDLDVELTESTKSKPQAATKVLQELGSILDEGINRVMIQCSKNDTHEALNLEFEISSALLKLQVQFEREVLPMEACLLSSTLPRSTDPLPIPIPPNEEHRLEAIRKEQLLEADDSEELSLICNLATQELSCMTSLVSIVDQELQYVLASSSPEFQNTEHPREHSLCQYLLMGDRPLILQHIEADPRFSHLEPVISLGIKFYAGFPIFSPDGLSVVGSLCCLDVCPRHSLSTSVFHSFNHTLFHNKSLAFYKYLFEHPRFPYITFKMRFTAATVAFFAGLAVAAPGAADQTVYETDEVTITSCAPTVTDCPGRSTAEPTGTPAVPSSVGASETPAWSETPAVSSETPAWSSETPAWSETPAVSSVPTWAPSASAPSSVGGWAPSSSAPAPAPPAVTSASYTVTAITTCMPTVVYSTVPVGPAPSGVSPTGPAGGNGGGVPHAPSGTKGVTSGTAAASPSASPAFNGAGALSGSLGFAGAAAAAAFFLA